MVQRLNIKCTFRFDVYKLVFLAISLLEFMRKIQRNSKSRVVAGSQSFLPNPDSFRRRRLIRIGSHINFGAGSESGSFSNKIGLDTIKTTSDDQG